MNDGLLIAASTFVLVMLVGFLVYFFSERDKKKQNLRERIKKEATPEQNEGVSKDRRWMEILLRMTNRLGESVKPKSDAAISQIRKKLARAGYYGENNYIVLLGSRIFTAFLFVTIFTTIKIAVLKAMPAQQVLILAILSVAAGFYLPDYYLYRRIRDRKRKIFEGFPDALDLMVVCVEAGMGLDAAIKRVGDEMALKNKVLSDEFRVLSLELRAGKTRADALRSLAVRADLEDVSSLVTLLVQTERFGTRVAQALRVHSDSMRTKRYQRAEEMAAKLPVKILFPLVFFILPAQLVTLVGPAIIKFYRVLLKGNLQW
jgi:tight adherence protein C